MYCEAFLQSIRRRARELGKVACLPVAFCSLYLRIQRQRHRPTLKDEILQKTLRNNQHLLCKRLHQRAALICVPLLSEGGKRRLPWADLQRRAPLVSEHRPELRLHSEPPSHLVGCLYYFSPVCIYLWPGSHSTASCSLRECLLSKMLPSVSRRPKRSISRNADG